MFDFLGIGNTLKSFAKELSTIRLEIETLTREAEDIQYAPANEADVLKALTAWAADNQLKYRAYLKTELSKLVNSPRDLGTNWSVHKHIGARGFLPDPHGGLPISRDVQMCGLLGPVTFVDMVKKQMDAMEWPPQGLLMAEREPAIAKIEKKITALRLREQDLLKSADKAGLEVS